MAASGGQPGNQNARKGKLWQSAIMRALEKRSKSDQMEALDELAEKLLVACDGGDLQALRELGDRIDGKAAQPLTDGDGGALFGPLVLAAQALRGNLRGATQEQSVEKHG